MATQVKDELMASDETYRRLAQEHSQYAQRLESLVTKRFLSEEEQIEETRLKKLKLRLKDQMEQIAHVPGAVVPPADGKVTDISPTMANGESRVRLSIFLNVFDVHVNRSPIAGRIKEVKYQSGKFCNAMDPLSADCNEQNVVTVQGQGHTVIFKQIAGLIARLIEFKKKVGDAVGLGERVGLLKFGW